VDNTTASSTSHLQAVHTHTLQPLASGVVRARHRKTPDGWRIAHLRLDEDITDADMIGFKQAVPRPD
jgi:hypothetical protein